MEPRPEPPPEAAEQRRGQRLLFVAALFGLLLTYPLLAAFDYDGRVGGVPVLFLYVLVAWVALIGLTGWLVRAKPHPLAPSPKKRGN